jgi:hypothetical protein
MNFDESSDGRLVSPPLPLPRCTAAVLLTNFPVGLGLSAPLGAPALQGSSDCRGDLRLSVLLSA